jgi:hypothetical protein
VTHLIEGSYGRVTAERLQNSSAPASLALGLARCLGQGFVSRRPAQYLVEVSVSFRPGATLQWDPNPSHLAAVPTKPPTGCRAVRSSDMNGDDINVVASTLSSSLCSLSRSLC